MTGPLRIITAYQTNPFEAGQGGGVRYVRNLLTEQARHSAEVLFLGVGEGDRQEDNIKLVALTRRVGGYLPFLAKLSLRILFMDLSRYQLVHVHRLYFAIPFLLLKPRLKVVCSLHGRTLTVFEERYGKGLLRLIKPLFMYIERFALARIDWLAPVSRDVTGSFSSKYPELMSRRLQQTSVIGSMLDLSEFQATESDYLQQRYGAQQRYLVFLGRLSSVKDASFLIQLFAKHFQERADLKLVLVGSGELDAELKQEALRSCPTNAPIFHGVIPSNEVPALLQSAELLLLCSQHEASPTIVKEALASGLAVITNPVGDVDEFIVSGRNGRIVEKQIDSYRDAIQERLDSPLTRAEVQAASGPALSSCTPEHVGQRFLDIYRMTQPNRSSQATEGSAH